MPRGFAARMDAPAPEFGERDSPSSADGRCGALWLDELRRARDVDGAPRLEAARAFRGRGARARPHLAFPQRRTRSSACAARVERGGGGVFGGRADFDRSPSGTDGRCERDAVRQPSLRPLRRWHAHFACAAPVRARVGLAGKATRCRASSLHGRTRPRRSSRRARFAVERRRTLRRAGARRHMID
jgi:hypothetical protein